MGSDSLDEFVNLELGGNIFIEQRSDATKLHTRRKLGFFLDLIFASFDDTFADVTPESLVAPLSSIPRVARRSASSYKYLSGSDSVELYDKENKRWQWILPMTEPATEQPSPATKTILKDPESLTSEGQVALFLNTIADSFAASRAGLVGENFTQGRRRQWLAKRITSSLPSSTDRIRKPDLVLVDRDMSPDDIEWINAEATAEYTKETFQPDKKVDTKAYMILGNQPWRRFILGLSIANSELRVHLYDHSGGTVSSPFNIHTDAQHVLFIIAALAFGCDASIGFDSTIEIDLVRLNERRRSARENISSTADATADDQDDPDPVEEPHPSPLPTRSPLPTLQEPLERPMPPSLTESVEGSPRLASPAILDSVPSLLPERTSAIGKIRVDDTYYDIIDILFSDTDFMGRGTVCYLARLEGVNYVVKDQWVRNPDGNEREIYNAMMIHEGEMMRRVKDLDGVPKLHKAWIVEVEEGISDRTIRYREEKHHEKMQLPRIHVRLAMTPRARPLTMFKSKKELVKSIRDVLRVIEQACELGVLHRDCSLSNIMIEDLPNNTSRGILIDWEFAVEITLRGQYSVIGTGTLPFVSLNIVGQLEAAFAKPFATTAQSVCKTASLTGVSIDDSISIHHTYADDVEYLLYVLTWIVVLYDGPLGQRRDIDDERTFLDQWNETSDLRIANDAKFGFIIRADSKSEIVDIYAAPYCRDLVPLVHQWRALYRNAFFTDTPVQISDVANVLDAFIATMPDEPQAEKVTPYRAQNQSSPAPRAVATPVNSSKCRLCDEVRSVDNPPPSLANALSGLTVCTFEPLVTHTLESGESVRYGL